MNETLRTLRERRSVRSYKQEQVQEAQLAQILEAGLYAPSGKGGQAAILVVVQDQQTISMLSQMNAAVMNQRDADPFYGAPTVVAVLADSSVMTWVEDGSLVLGNLMNAAASVGVDSCWIHRSRQVFDTAAGKAMLRSWGVSEGCQGVGFCILGYREKEPAAAAARRENRIFRI